MRRPNRKGTAEKTKRYNYAPGMEAGAYADSLFADYRRRYS